MQVIKSAVDCGDGMSIEREHPSTASRSMPAYGALNSSFKAQPIDELTGTFDALNETTNVRPAKGESISIVHPEFRTGLISPDQMRPVDSLSETCGDGDPKILGPISGNGVFKPQDIDTKGSVIFGDNHFMPDRGGDSITGEGRRMNIWGNGGASTFKDSNRVWQDCNNIKSDTDFDMNDAVLGMRQNIGTTAGPGGSTCMTETFEPAAGIDRSIKGIPVVDFEDIGSGDQDNNDVVIGVRENVSGTIGYEMQPDEYFSHNPEWFAPGSTVDSWIEKTFGNGDGEHTFSGSFNLQQGDLPIEGETFQPAAGMNSFGESLNPAPGLGGTAGPGATSFLSGQFDFPTNNIAGSASPGGDTV